MNQRDLSEIRRRLNPSGRNPSVIRGCYLTRSGECISEFLKPVANLPEEENAKYMTLFKKVLSGSMGQNLLTVDVPMEFIPVSEDYQLLLRLRDTALMDSDAVQVFYQKVAQYISSLSGTSAETGKMPNYLILLLHETWDVPVYDANGQPDSDESETVFSYMMACICPVKQSQPQLSYSASDKTFYARDGEWFVTAPDFGFLFPAWEDHGANIARAMFYTRDASNTHEELILSLFGTTLMPATEQKTRFEGILTQTLGEELDYGVLRAVQETVTDLIDEAKSDKSAEPLSLSKEGIHTILTQCGVTEERAEAFEEAYEEAFGAAHEVPAAAIAPPRSYAIQTPSVSIRVAPENSNMIETRIIDGRKYVMILVDGPVEVNGVEICVSTQDY